MHCLSPLSERTASPQPCQSESHVPPSQAGQGTLNCVQFRSVARTHLENVGFRFHSLRQRLTQTRSPTLFAARRSPTPRCNYRPEDVQIPRFTNVDY
jgi:hypothetical protein